MQQICSSRSGIKRGQNIRNFFDLHRSSIQWAVKAIRARDGNEGSTHSPALPEATFFGARSPPSCDIPLTATTLNDHGSLGSRLFNNGAPTNSPRQSNPLRQPHTKNSDQKARATHCRGSNYSAKLHPTRPEEKAFVILVALPHSRLLPALYLSV
jgi:hypothetical protein